MTFSPAFERLLLRATTAFVDLGDGALPPPEVNGTLVRLRAMGARLPRDQVRLLHAGGLALDLLAVLRFRRRFAALGDRQARAVLRACARSALAPLRRLYFVLKMMTQFAYFAGEAAWPAVGYDGPWLGRIAVETLPPPRLGAEERA